MFFIIYVVGCLPYVDIAINADDGHAIPFDTEEKAEKYAEEHYAWNYKVVEFN